MINKQRTGLLVAILWLVTCCACGPYLGKADRQSQEQYRKSYERSGGLDPISKSVKQHHMR